MRTRLLPTFVLLSVLASAQTYTESILYNFGSSLPDGEAPNSDLVMDVSGNLYGTTPEGTIYNKNCSKGFGIGCGTVYKISPAGVETLLHIFTGGTDGAAPEASLAMDKSGNLYGTTSYGGLSCGTVFKVTAAGKYSILHKFRNSGSGDGCNPYGTLTLDSAGNLYGTTFNGGSTAGECGENGIDGCGTIFKINPSGAESVLYAFTYGTGSFPLGNILRDSKGNLYALGNNFLFELTSDKLLVTLYDFSGLGLVSFGLGNPDIVRNAEGNYYGVAVSFNDGSENEGIWQVTDSGVESTYYFCESCTFSDPGGDDFGGPLIFSGGNLYATAGYGGENGAGVVYEFSPLSGTETVIYNFGGLSSTTDGCIPQGGVISDANGNLYGTTLSCGTSGLGTVFKLTKSE